MEERATTPTHTTIDSLAYFRKIDHLFVYISISTPDLLELSQQNRRQHLHGIRAGVFDSIITNDKWWSYDLHPPQTESCISSETDRYHSPLEPYPCPAETCVLVIEEHIKHVYFYFGTAACLVATARLDRWAHAEGVQLPNTNKGKAS